MITFSKLGQYGRLGNQMFQIAGTIGLAVAHGFYFGFPRWINYDHRERFQSAEDCDVQKYFMNELPAMEQADYFPKQIPWGYHQVKVRDWQDIHGHMQCEKYFLHCRELIQIYFEMYPLGKFTPGKNSIALHVRLGDYDDNYHPRLRMDNYYRKALEQFSDGFTVYVFSDDISAAKKLLNNTSYEYVEGYDYMTDFYFMRQCKHFIIGNSTFSWWPAWLSDQGGQVIAPSYWFGPVARVSSEDIYCKNWRVL